MPARYGPNTWRQTHEGVPAPELGWVDRKVWEDDCGRTLEVVRHYGSDDYRAALLSPRGGLLVFREGKDPAKLVGALKRAARKLPVTAEGESLIERGGELYLSRPTDAHPRDLTEFDLFLIEQYEVMCFRESKEGLRVNGRLVLAMVREIRRHRAALQKPVTKSFGLDVEKWVGQRVLDGGKVHVGKGFKRPKEAGAKR